MIPERATATGTGMVVGGANILRVAPRHPDKQPADTGTPPPFRYLPRTVWPGPFGANP